MELFLIEDLDGYLVCDSESRPVQLTKACLVQLLAIYGYIREM
jgi:hypothetical protein